MFAPSSLSSSAERRLLRRKLRAAFLRWRYARPLAEIRRYAIFIGYPRSGHTLVAALLDAHSHMLFANGLDVASYIAGGFSAAEVAALSIWNSLRFTRCGRRSNGFDYAVPEGAHGRWDRLQVVGDKSGDLLSASLRREPGLILQLMREFKGAARFIHVIRNPFDCIATMAARSTLSLHDAADEFFTLCEANRRARSVVPPSAWQDLQLEALIADCRPHLQRLCRFLGVEADERYVAACERLVFRSPRRSREQVQWPAELIDAVRDRMARFDWLTPYGPVDVPFSTAGMNFASTGRPAEVASYGVAAGR